MIRKKKKLKGVHQARWREKYPERSIACSKSWRDRHPGWYRGRNYVRLLENALIKGLANATVFSRADMTIDQWMASASFYQTELANGSRLAPIKSWREFDLNDKEQVKQFLAPGNFKLVSK